MVFCLSSDLFFSTLPPELNGYPVGAAVDVGCFFFTPSMCQAVESRAGVIFVGLMCV